MTQSKMERMQLRRAKLVKWFNKGQRKKYLRIYAIDAVLRDPDLPAIIGIKNLKEYFTVLFQYINKWDRRPRMMLRSKRTLVKGKFIYDTGVYCLSTIRCGRYVHKWEWIKDDYYLISDRFTIQQSLLHGNDENANAIVENIEISS